MHADARQLGKEDAKRFVTGGYAKFTLVSRKTGTRYTYQAKHPSKRTQAGGFVLDRTGSIFVSVLTGPSNTQDYAVLGTLFDKSTYKHNKQRSKISEEAPSAVAFRWLWWLLQNPEAQEFPEDLEFWTSGSCCCCSRELTVPASIEAGMGPDCAERYYGIILSRGKKGGSNG